MMVNMEIKLLRLEAKVERREAAQRQPVDTIPGAGQHILPIPTALEQIESSSSTYQHGCHDIQGCQQ